MGLGTDFRTKQTPEKKSNCSNAGTVLVSVPVFILTLVPSLRLGPRLGLVRCRVSVLVSVWYQFSGLVSVPVVVLILGIELGSVPGLTPAWVSVSEWVLMAVYVCEYPRFSFRRM